MTETSTLLSVVWKIVLIIKTHQKRQSLKKLHFRADKESKNNDILT